MIKASFGVQVLLALVALVVLAVCVPDAVERSLALNPPTEMVVPQSPPLSAREIESQVLDLANAQRQQAGLCSLQALPALNTVARTRSQDMLERRYLSHHDPETQELAAFKLLAKEGFHGGGENLYLVQGLTDGVSQSAVAWWMNSRTHRANILRPDYRYAGVGVAIGSTGIYVTQIFLERQ